MLKRCFLRLPVYSLPSKLTPEVMDVTANTYSLSSLRTDDQLDFSVTKVFQEFGTVWVKIRRDSKGMPFAFCQYEVHNIIL